MSLGIPWRKVFWLAVLALVIYFITNDPAGAADSASGIGQTLKGFADSIIRFLTEVTR